jgi:hypothetical protein
VRGRLANDGTRNGKHDADESAKRGPTTTKTVSRAALISQDTVGESGHSGIKSFCVFGCIGLCPVRGLRDDVARTPSTKQRGEETSVSPPALACARRRGNRKRPFLRREWGRLHVQAKCLPETHAAINVSMLGPSVSAETERLLVTGYSR